ncbi:hypothetical protein SO3561_10191 [Streptomyces olivochromogenes]|uniref:Uncharacterized protein n=1 Tax=Streptomyces olivochromogenes TaxID=1963 RepID=A0A286PGD8_STROL|nr:hypothetical protein SO3561_10191 [Streptomyces olivochromogenes]
MPGRSPAAREHPFERPSPTPRIARAAAPTRVDEFFGRRTVGVDAEESRRLQNSLVDANVLHHIADTFTADLESPFFNGIKVFYGGQPGKVQAENRVNGERHEAGSAALAAMDLPEPNAFTMVRAYALLLPMPEDGTEPPYPPARLDLTHTRACGCGNQPA